jgi:hypothetical protein
MQMSLTRFFTRPRRWWDPVILGPVALLVCIALLCSGGGTTKGKANAEAKAAKHVAEARSQMNAALDRHLRGVRAVFERGRKGAPAFASEALSLSGKWALIKSAVRFEAVAHATFLAEAFAKHVFTGDELEAAVKASVQGYVSELDAIENQMLVRLRIDLSDGELGRSGKLPALDSDSAFRGEYRRLAESLTRTLHADAGVEAGRFVAGWVAMDAATPVVISVVELVAAELGVEGGILGAGAASGVATLGIGLIVGYVADQIIAWLLKEVAGYDPEEKIAGKVRDSLGRVESLLIDGAGGRGGLRRELERIGKTRSDTQSRVINQLLKEGGVS